MTPSTYIEISKSALINNLKFIRSLIGDKVIFSSVVKGNAYGHGIETIVPLEEAAGVSHFSVFNAEEALRVKNSIKGKSTILIMGMLTDDQLEWAIRNGIEFFIFDFYRLKKAGWYAGKLKKPAVIHLEMETGMNRTGIPLSETGRFIRIADEMEYVRIKGLCTHFAGAENIANYYRIKKQRATFRRAVKKMESLGTTALQRHAACSAAVIKYPDTLLDMVRIGILQYGYFPSSEVKMQYMIRKKEFINPLQQVISWKSMVMGLKNVKKGEFVGYGTTYFANSDMRIATVPIGYSHGFSRSLSNHGRVLINNRYAPVVGLVNMSMLSVDISDIPDVQNGSEVVIIGRQGDQELSVASFSDYSNQINYELLTRLPPDIERMVVD